MPSTKRRTTRARRTTAPYRSPQVHRTSNQLSSAENSSSEGGSASVRKQPQASSSSTETKPRTAAERSREQKLRSDPLAEVVDAYFVDCRRCLTRIKLSAKSTFDLFHWRKHRERCLKRSASMLREIRQQVEDDSLSSLTTPSSTPSSSKRSPKRLVAPATPPLTPDTDEENDSASAPPSPIKQESPSPPSDLGRRTPDPHHPASVLASLTAFHGPDLLAFEDYLYRSRRRSTRAYSPLLTAAPERWQAWSWGQLKAPVWVLKKYPSSGEPATEEDGMDVDADPGVGDAPAFVTALRVDAPEAALRVVGPEDDDADRSVDDARDRAHAHAPAGDIAVSVSASPQPLAAPA